MFSVDRIVDSFGQPQYECRCCSAPPHENIRNIDHDNSCPVNSPDSAKTPLTDETHQTILEILDITQEVEQTGYLQNEITTLREIDGVRWVDTGSTSRVVFGLGKTNNRGQFHLDDHRGIVVKVDPHPRFRDIVGRSGNVDELHTWEIAVANGMSHFFADILGCALDGTWLVMEEAIPIYPRHRSEMKDRDAIWSKEMINMLISEMKSKGWSSFDWKHGNIGYCSDGEVRVIDYGTGPELP